jgi:hypothetical protein
MANRVKIRVLMGALAHPHDEIYLAVEKSESP